MSQEDPLEKEMATHSSILVGKSHGQRSLVGYSPWSHERVGCDLAAKQPPLPLDEIFWKQHSQYPKPR